MISEEIERLIRLRNSGALSEDEFLLAKQKVINGGSAPPQSFASVSSGLPNTNGAVRIDSGLVCGVDQKVWCTLMHASQLLTWTGVGIVAPIVMWLISKDESREANRHGIAIVNWMLSSLVYLVISGLACLIVIGIPMLFVLAGLNILFPVVGAVYASRGTLWRYPLTINFFNPEPAG
jgi:uncharacterized Tic20 family protein